jgi:diguanylate cyclase (GGDEF)-like protein
LERINGSVARHQLRARRAKSHDLIGHSGVYPGCRRVPSAAFLDTASKDRRAWNLGIRFYHSFGCNDAYHRPTRLNSRLLVDHRRQRTSRYRLWDLVGWRAKVRRQKRLDPLALIGVVLWIVACSIGPIYSRPEARATVMAAIGVVYTLLVVFELWRGRGDQVWRWPIMVLLLAHAAAIPIYIPLAGALTHPDPSEPSDLDLLTFAVFEGAFVCICTAYLFGGLAKDRIASRYRRASLTDPLTGVANRRGFFETGERLLMRARFARESTALIMFDLDRFKSINDRYGHHIGDGVITVFCRLATSLLRLNDLFGRVGGEEFACLLPVIGRRDALWLAERVRAAFEAVYHTIGEHRLTATVSVGVAIADDSSLDLDTLLKQADQALGRAKSVGRNCVETGR